VRRSRRIWRSSFIAMAHMADLHHEEFST
jgi:hypothetical protein